MKASMEYPTWLLATGTGGWVAVAKPELKHIENIADTVRLPTAPHHCQQMMLWRGQLLPLFDVGLFVALAEDARDSSARQTDPQQDAALTAILAYRTRFDTGLRYGGIPIVDAPRLVHVSQSQARDVSELSRGWQCLSHAALAIPLNRSGEESSVQQLVPLLDLGSLFAKSAAELTEAG